MSTPSPRCAVIAYPRLTDADRDWIESVRARHDPQAELIAAHVTLAFPAPVDPSAMARAAAQAVGTSAPVPFAIGLAQAVPDAHAGGAHVFLVIDEGRDAIAALHDAFYAGLLAPHRRPDIPFIPHITVAAHADLAWCRDFADNLNRTLPRLRATIDALDVIAIGISHVETVARLTLGAASGE
jgi:2'-5' RNA ligase